MYRCWKCREPMKANLNSVGLQCERCGSKIFYKERPNTTKIVKAR
ncbi:MAG: DNA-directed RNA polymerase subunit P [Thermoplasmata archaeon]|nr:DNA-directed RNA polymerase subunit P [Thermoplasmata archaeon]